MAPIGRRLPAYATGVGKALLAGLTDEQVIALYPPRLPALTSSTLTTHDRLLEELRQVRQHGYALDDEESTPGVRCVAVALVGDAVRTAAFSLAIPVQRAPIERLHDLAPRLQRAAAEIQGRVSRLQRNHLESWNLGLPRT